MKKKAIASLALAGALAATMMPAFAANPTTTVGYMAGGNASTDGRVMVSVPKDVTFTAKGEAINGFDVKSYVWSIDESDWVEASAANKLNKEIGVSVASTNGYKLTNDSYAGVEGAYQYEVGTFQDGTALQSGKDSVQIGTLKDDGEVYALTGTVTMTTTPNVGQTEKAVHFTDTLTYTFTGLTNP